MSATDFKPYISANREIPELTVKAVLLGIILGAVFGATSIYLGLKIGQTVSASIPAAVLAVAIFKRAGSSILENNIVQTISSAGDTVAAGLTFTMPALIMLGYELEFSKMMLLASIGGLIGIFFMIPLRRMLIVKEHGTLTYPEGTACADVLVAGESGGNSAKILLGGFGIGTIYKLLMSVFGLWKDNPLYSFKGYQGATISAEISPELLGAGYIIGPRNSARIFAGGFIAWFCLMPMIKFFGQNALLAIAPSKLPIADMGMMDLWKNYIRYIGGGAVVMSGLICVFKALPIIWQSFRSSLQEIRGGNLFGNKNAIRTDQDFPIAITLLGSLALVFVIAVSPVLPVGMGATSVVAAVLIVILGFFFTTVSSRITGIVGSTSNPLSGMTITALMITCLVFLMFGWKGSAYAATAISIGAVLCVAIAGACATSQDLKTGFLVGATPWKQQASLVIGTLTATATASIIMIMLNKAGMTHGAGIGSAALPAPKGQLMAIIVQGVLEQTLPWSLILFGMAVSLVIELAGVESLPVSVGIYLPIAVSTPMFIGGIIHWLVKKLHTSDNDSDLSPGILYSAGLIAGGAIMGVVVTLGNGFWEKAFEAINFGAKWGLGDKASAPWGDVAAVIMFGLMMVSLFKTARKKI